MQEFINDVRNGCYPVFMEESYLYEMFLLVLDEGLNANRKNMTICTVGRPTKMENAMLRYPLKGVHTIYDQGKYSIEINVKPFVDNLSMFYCESLNKLKERASAREAKYRRRLYLAEKTGRKLGIPENPYRVFFTTGKIPTYGDEADANITYPTV